MTPYQQTAVTQLTIGRAIDELKRSGVPVSWSDNNAALKLMGALRQQCQQDRPGFIDSKNSRFIPARGLDHAKRSDRARSRDCEHRARDQRGDLSAAGLQDVERWLQGFDNGSRQDREFAALLSKAIRSYLSSTSDSDWMTRSADRSRKYGEAAMRRRAGDADNSDTELIRRAICGFARPATNDEEWIYSNAMHTFTS